MLGKKSPPVIGKLITGNLAGLMGVATSPRSPSEFKIQSPRSLKHYDAGGVGLAIIVAALEKSGEGGGEIPAKNALFSRNLNRSEPIPVRSPKPRVDIEERETESLEEDYTYVTCRGPNKSYTRVYCDRRGGANNVRACVFDISPARFGDVTAYPTSDFLSSCHLCKKKLHGKDIYMYRGEKAFCSTECRYRQIAMDERKEECRSEASRSVDVSNSPFTNGHGQIFSTGILAL